MEATLKYKVIKDRVQYNEYCDILEEMVFSPNREDYEDEIDLLTTLIEKWNAEYNTLNIVDPVQLLASFMEDHKLKSVQLANILKVSPSLISDILHYRKGFSRMMICKLAAHFKVRQEAFNRPYEMKNDPANKSRHGRDVVITNAVKKFIKRRTPKLQPA